MLHSPPHLLSSSPASSAILLPHFSCLHYSNFIRNPTKPYSLSQQFLTRPLAPLLAQVSDSASPEEGPIELPFSTPSFISTDDEPSTLQVATSVLLTGAISVFLFRSLRRRAKRAKELKFRSTGAKKTLKEEAIDSLKAMTPVEANAPPSPLQALLGGLSAGVIALILYKFTTPLKLL